VRSWIFRHRLRLRAIYAPRPALLPAPIPRQDGRSGRGPVVVERQGGHTILRTSFGHGPRANRNPAA